MISRESVFAPAELADLADRLHTETPQWRAWQILEWLIEQALALEALTAEDARSRKQEMLDGASEADRSESGTNAILFAFTDHANATALLHALKAAHGAAERAVDDL